MSNQQHQQQQQQQQPAAQPVALKPVNNLEEDDEFEDFPVEDWTADEQQSNRTAVTHLWEESWDDDYSNEDFSKQLKEEIAKVATAK